MKGTETMKTLLTSIAATFMLLLVGPAMAQDFHSNDPTAYEAWAESSFRSGIDNLNYTNTRYGSFRIGTASQYHGTNDSQFLGQSGFNLWYGALTGKLTDNDPDTALFHEGIVTISFGNNANNRTFNMSMADNLRSIGLQNVDGNVVRDASSPSLGYFLVDSINERTAAVTSSMRQYRDDTLRRTSGVRQNRGVHNQSLHGRFYGIASNLTHAAGTISFTRLVPTVTTRTINRSVYRWEIDRVSWARSSFHGAWQADNSEDL